MEGKKFLRMEKCHSVPTLRSLIAVILSSSLFFSQQILSAKNSQPANPKEETLQFRDRISQHGITWTFNRPAPVGRFVNGDYYIVGNVTVVSITPKPEEGRNGSVLNLPPYPGRSGFDSRVKQGRYDAGLRASLPIHMKPRDSLISTISMEKLEELPAPLRPKDKAVSPIRSASVLTCLPEPVPPDAFRPSYCDRGQKIFLGRNLRWELLLQLPPVEGGMEQGPWKITPEDWADRFQRPWLDVCFFGFDAPVEYMPHYGHEVGRAVGVASLVLQLDYPKERKERLLINFVQYGIDLWGIVRAGHRGWPALGGHGSGRKWPIIFAGLLLGDEDMQSPIKRYPNLKFGEDMQTMYGQGWTGAKVVYAGHAGKKGRIDKIGWGAYEHLHPSKWVNETGESYRRCCTSTAWVGQALAARLMKAEKVWAHDAFFDYVDRWMTEDDTQPIQEMKKARGWDYSANWARQSQARDPFINNMWRKYR
jgi:hypothetical protein